MNSKHRHIPVEVTQWMEKDVKIRKLQDNLGVTSNDTRSDFFLRRQFYLKMFNLSAERYQKIGRMDFDKKKFLRGQRLKAETTLPGLLPYVEQHEEEEEDLKSSSRSTFRKANKLTSTSYQSFASNSFVKSTSTFVSKQPSIKENKNIQSTLKKSSNHQQQIPDRIQHAPIHKSEFISRSTYSLDPKTLTPEMLFGDIENVSSYDSFSMKKPQTPVIRDQRFRQLVYLFSETPEQEPTTPKSVQKIIESNSSLQDANGKWKNINIPLSARLQAKLRDEKLAAHLCRKKNNRFIDVDFIL